DTRLLVSAMKDHCVASGARVATNELDAVYVAFLIEADQAGELERVVEDLSDRWRGRVELHVRGPMAPYDFVGDGGWHEPVPFPVPAAAVPRAEFREAGLRDQGRG